MIRVYLTPRSYFTQYNPYLGKWFFPLGIFEPKRWDLNIGLTQSTKTDKDNGPTDKKSYFLVGLSNQINRYAFLNIGRAYVEGATVGVNSQYYLGFTIDFDLLKSIGIIDK